MTSTTSAKSASTSHFGPNYFDKAWVDERLPMDDELVLMSRSQVLNEDKFRRARWFHLLQVSHAELQRVSELVYQLLDPYNPTRIIVIVGMTSVGKSALAKNIIPFLIEKLYGPVEDCYLPYIYSKAPANGDRRIPWSTIYAEWLKAAQEPFIDRKRTFEVSNGIIKSIRGHSPALRALKDSLGEVLLHRRVKAIGLDEVLHMLRFEDYAACMDTFKHLSDDREAKLVLFGPFETARIIAQYGQSLGRTELIHFRRYVTEQQSSKYNNCVEYGISGGRGFHHVAQTLESVWPAEIVPPLAKMCGKYLMPNCMGAVGLLKKFALSLFSMQTFHKDERLSPEMFRDAAKSYRMVEQTEKEIALGEQLIYGACHGQNRLGEASALEDIAQLLAHR